MNFKNIILLCALAFAPFSHAAPSIKLCIDDNCQTKVNVTLSNEQWSEISEIFSAPIQHAQQERKAIAKALSVIEKHSLNSLASRSIEKISAAEIHNRMSNKDQAINYKTYFSLLLDYKLIQHHFLRKTEQRSSWLGANEYSVVFQNHASGNIYSLDASDTDFSTPPVITHLRSWKNKKTIKNLSNKTMNFIGGNAEGHSKTQFKKNAP